LRELQFDPPLDPGIAPAVLVLRDAGVETFESCEGGEGHSYPEPTVRFHGQPSLSFRLPRKRGIPIMPPRSVPRPG
jgi:hypothetical protein